MKSKTIFAALAYGLACLAATSSAAPVTIEQPGFEGASGRGTVSLPPWRRMNRTDNVIGIESYTGTGGLGTKVDPVPNGGNYLHYNNGPTDSIYQVLSASLQANTTYTLSIQAIDRSDLGFQTSSLRLGYVPGTDNGTTGDNIANSFYGEYLLTPTSIVNPTPVNGTAADDGWKVWTYTFTTGASHPGLGQPIRIEIVGSGVQSLFDNVQLDATVTVVDSTPPAVVTLVPADDATGVLPNANLSLTFDEPVAKGTGDIVIKNSGGATVQTIPAANTTVSGATVTIDPPFDLAGNTSYYVEIPGSAITDLVGNPFSGISGNSAWNFTTASVTPITIGQAGFEGASGSGGSISLPPWKRGSTGTNLISIESYSGLGTRLDAVPGGGNYLLYFNSTSDSIYQVLAATLQANMTYTLSIQAADRTDQTFQTCSLQFGYVPGTDDGTTGDNKANDFFGEYLLTPASVVNPTPVNGAAADDGWKVWTYTFTTGASPAGLGSPLRVEIVQSAGGAQSLFDNISLTAQASGAPGPVDHFVISAISSPQTVGTPITGITITAQDASNATATSFTSTVTFGGTGGFSGTSGNFVNGVLTGVSVTPTVAGSNLTLTVDDGAGHTGLATIGSIQTQYQAWLAANGKTNTTENLNEFAFGTTHTGPLELNSGGTSIVTRGQAPIIRTTVGSPVVTLTYARRKNSGCTYSAQYSTDLGQWLASNDSSLIYPPEAPAGETVLDNGDDMEIVSVSFPIFRNTGSGLVKIEQNFCRIAVSSN